MLMHDQLSITTCDKNAIKLHFCVTVVANLNFPTFLHALINPEGLKNQQMLVFQLEGSWREFQMRFVS